MAKKPIPVVICSMVGSLLSLLKAARGASQSTDTRSWYFHSLQDLMADFPILFGSEWDRYLDEDTRKLVDDVTQEHLRDLDRFINGRWDSRPGGHGCF